jgi:DNA-binding transcriptional LysR family regulator
MLAHVLLGAAAAVAAALGLLPAPTGRRFLGMLPLPAEAGWMVPELLAAGAAYVVLGQLTFSGRTLPRFLTLALSVGGILIGILEGPDAPEGLAFQLWLVNLALDIGILVTLSGGDVRDFDLRTPGGRYVPLS